MTLAEEKEHCLFVARVLHDTLAYDTPVVAAWFHETASKDPCQVCADIAAVIEIERAQARAQARAETK